MILFSIASEYLVELVGLELTTRVLWKVGVSDQLTRSNTMRSSSNRCRAGRRGQVGVGQVGAGQVDAAQLGAGQIGTAGLRPRN